MHDQQPCSLNRSMYILYIFFSLSLVRMIYLKNTSFMPQCQNTIFIRLGGELTTMHIANPSKELLLCTTVQRQESQNNNVCFNPATWNKFSPIKIKVTFIQYVTRWIFCILMTRRLTFAGILLREPQCWSWEK